MDSKFKVFVIIALIVLGGVAITGTFVAITVMNNAKTTDENLEHTYTDPKDIEIMSLSESITANLVGEANSKRVAKLTIGFGVDSKDKTYKDVSSRLQQEEMIIRNEIIKILRAQTYEVMSQVDSQEKLGIQIKDKVNELLNTQAIKEVYFGEFFVQ